jgi:hypothetical protein
MVAIEGHVSAIGVQMRACQEETEELLQKGRCGEDLR